MKSWYAKNIFPRLKRELRRRNFLFSIPITRMFNWNSIVYESIKETFRLPATEFYLDWNWSSTLGSWQREKCVKNFSTFNGISHETIESWRMFFLPAILLAHCYDTNRKKEKKKIKLLKKKVGSKLEETMNRSFFSCWNPRYGNKKVLSANIFNLVK